MKTTRREWLELAAASCGMSGLANLFDKASLLQGDDRTAKWQIGCYNRPWMPWSYDEALDGIKNAGFTVTGILGDHPGEPFTSPQATAKDIDQLKARLAARNLRVIVGWLRVYFERSLTEMIQDAKTQIDNAHALGMSSLLTVGVDPPDQYARFYQVMSAAADYGAAQNVQIVIKPHGGISATAADMLRCVEQIDHDNFRIWYDAGNTVHYTDRDPVEELRLLGKLVTGFCAKECSGRGQGVMLPFGSGKVDFPKVMSELKRFGFDGPIMVECCGGSTQAEITEGARTNRLFVEELIRKL